MTKIRKETDSSVKSQLEQPQKRPQNEIVTDKVMFVALRTLFGRFDPDLDREGAKPFGPFRINKQKTS
jgi:hypothetical protein